LTTLPALLERSGIVAVRASPDVAESPDLEIGSPLLSPTRLVSSARRAGAFCTRPALLEAVR
jgi:hypothetical protein